MHGLTIILLHRVDVGDIILDQCNTFFALKFLVYLQRGDVVLEGFIKCTLIAVSYTKVVVGSRYSFAVVDFGRQVERFPTVSKSLYWVGGNIGAEKLVQRLDFLFCFSGIQHMLKAVDILS